MANGLNSIVKRDLDCKPRGDSAKMGSRRIFTPQFKLQVLDSYRQDSDCKGNQRATARKYGIHRRQIQKWLQVENNLRTSVVRNGGSERAVTLDCGRQGDAVANAICPESGMRDSRKASPPVSPRATALCSPAPTPVARPLDFSTRDRNSRTDDAGDRLCRPAEPQPIDLSLRRRSLNEGDVTAICVSASSTRYEMFLPSVALPTVGIWDLSCRKRRYDDTFHDGAAPELPECHKSEQCSPKSEVSSSSETVNTCAIDAPPSKTVKLFKPYLLSDEREQGRDKNKMAATAASAHSEMTPLDVIHTTSESYESDKDAYTWHRTVNNNVLYSHSYEYLTDGYRYCPSGYDTKWQHSPDYESVRSRSPEDVSLSLSLSLSLPRGETMECDTSSYLTPSVRQRQSYSLGFKLSAIDSYYHDMECRGNQRAVAQKFKIHRRQVQKWLKQEDLLRQRVYTASITTL